MIFLCENRRDRSKSQKLNTFFCNSHRADVQNHDFSENRRWGPYKITKMSRKIDTHGVIAEKH